MLRSFHGNKEGNVGRDIARENCHLQPPLNGSITPKLKQIQDEYTEWRKAIASCTVSFFNLLYINEQNN